MANFRNDKLPVILIFIGALIVIALGIYVAQPGANQTEDGKPLEQKSDVQINVVEDPTSITIKKPQFLDGELTFDDSTIEVPKGQDPKKFALNTYLAQLSYVPVEATVQSVTMDGSVAVVDFSEAIEAGYGTEDESILINGLLASLSQFEGVDWMRLTVNGKPLTTLGSSDLTDPLPVPEME